MRIIYNYLYLILTFYFITFMFQVLLIHKSKYEYNKFFPIFKSIFIAIILSFPFYYQYIQFALDANQESDLSDGLMSILIFWGILILFILQGVVGLFIGKKIKKETNELSNIRYKKISFKAFIITAISFILVLIFSMNIPKLIKSNIEDSIETDTINYLNNKYGDYGFSVINISERYGYNGIVQKYLTGYNITINSSSINKNFQVSSGTKHESFSDDFIYSYYEDFFNSIEYNQINQKLLTDVNSEIDSLEKYLKQYNKISIRRLTKVNIDSSVIPDNYGKIPSIDELYKLTKQNTLNYELEIIIDNNAIDRKVYSIKEAKEILETLRLDPKIKFSLSGLTVYKNKKVYKVYSSEEELMDKLIIDLSHDGGFGITSILRVRNALIDYYGEIASHILQYYPNINEYRIKCNYGGYIIIDSTNIYISTYGYDTDTVEKIIKR